MSNQQTFIANHITTSYDKKVIIDDVSLTIPIGKISVIIGANACGKSTFLKTLARLLKPKTGEIVLNGQEIANIPTKKLAQKIGLLPQTPIIPEGISVFDLVSRGRYPYQKAFSGLDKEDYAAIQEALEIMKITDIVNCSVDELSGGQRQRVWIAMALAQQTDILLLDEPTTYLDIAYQVEILDLLTDLNRRKKTTIVMVLHDINLSARYADYIFAFSKGNLIKGGKPNDIIDASLIETVFGLACVVIPDPLSNTPFIIPKGKYHI